MVDDVPSRTKRPVSTAISRLPARFQQRCRPIAATSRFSSAFSVFLAAFFTPMRLLYSALDRQLSGQLGQFASMCGARKRSLRVEPIWLGVLTGDGLGFAGAGGG